MPEATDITKRIKQTLPALHETKINVAIKGRGNISKHKDVFEKYREPGGSVGGMGACLMMQAEDESTNPPKEDIKCDQPRADDEEQVQRSQKKGEKGNDHGLTDMDKGQGEDKDDRSKDHGQDE